MNDPYGPLHKTPWSILFFAIPAAAVIGSALALMVQETGSLTAALGSFTMILSSAIALLLVIAGAVFVRRPIVTLTPDAILWPNGHKLAWADITAAEDGQSTATIVSANTGPRSVVHEVVRLHHGDNDVTKIVTTWAAAGPQAANDRIIAAFANSR